MKMKRILSSILAAATVASVMLFPTSAEVQSVTQEVDVLYLSQMPTFDGDITAEEWGEKSFSVSGKDAAKPGDTAPSAKNTFVWYEHVYDELGKVITSENEAEKNKIVNVLTYDVWLRWDLEYLYLAVKVIDPDGYYLPSGREKIWDGDCVQFRVDPQGPNGYLDYKDPSYDYKTQGFDLEKAAGVGHMPWSYATKICNIGLGTVNGKVQAYDMAEQGTGNMTAKQLLNDPKKMGPDVNPLGDSNNYASEFNMKITDNGDGTFTNTYECAVPWVFLNQWNYGQVAVGYAWGMSLVVLNGYDDGDAQTAAFESYLTWGSGICGAQHDDAYLRPTCGGSNAIILSDKDALTGQTVADLPQYQEPNPDDDKVVHNVMDVTGMEAYYLGSSEEIGATEGDFEVSLDIAYLGDDPINPDRTYVGVLLGEGYTMAAGWDASAVNEDTGAGKEFFIADQGFNNGIDKSIPYAKSEEKFEWEIGDWHNLSVKVADETVTISLDGEVVLEDTDKRYVCSSTTPIYQIVVYNIGDFVYDNYRLVTGDTDVLYTFDSNDEAFNRSDMRLNAIPMFNEVVKGECKNANEASLYNCLLRPAVNAEGENVMMCEYCGYEEAAATVYGDVTGDGAVTVSDVTKVLQYIAKWDGVEVDVNVGDVTGDGAVTVSDVTKMLQYIAKWDGVDLNPNA